MEKFLDNLFGGFKWYRDATRVSWSHVTLYGDARSYGSWWVRGDHNTDSTKLVLEKEVVA